jgi:hypothetical protein
MTGPQHAAATEADRTPAISSIAAVAARYLPELVELAAAELPQPLAGVGAPSGWRLAQLTGGGTAPARMLVYGQRPDGSWEGCDTIRAFTFTGHLDPNVVYANADCTLRSLAGEHITAGALAAPARAIAARSAGYFTAGRQFWAQFSTYLANPMPPARGLLIEHSIVTDADRRAELRDDITNLSDAVHHAFLAITGYTVGDGGDSAAGPVFRHFRYDATGLRGKRMRLTDDLPTSDSLRPQEALIGVTDVICLDDTPSVLHNLRVHPVGQPDTVGLVEYSQLALYEGP